MLCVNLTKQSVEQVAEISESRVGMTAQWRHDEIYNDVGGLASMTRTRCSAPASPVLLFILFSLSFPTDVRQKPATLGLSETESLVTPSFVGLLTGDDVRVYETFARQLLDWQIDQFFEVVFKISRLQPRRSRFFVVHVLSLANVSGRQAVDSGQRNKTHGDRQAPDDRRRSDFHHFRYRLMT